MIDKRVEAQDVGTEAYEHKAQDRARTVVDSRDTTMLF